jgi:hypothetical protein
MDFRAPVLAALAAAFLAVPAGAAEYVNSAKKFSLTLPSCWQLTSELPSEVFFSCTGNEELGAAVEILAANTKLNDPAVVSRIDLSNRKVTKDVASMQAGLPARRIEGTARSEGQNLNFYAIAIQPATGPVIEVDIWATPADAKRPEMRKMIEAMLASFKPLE